MKVYFKKYKYFWIGGIMGIAQQFLGELDSYLYHGHGIFSFSAVMGGLSLYAFIILFVIKREVPPKQQCKDLFLFFLGLDFLYYAYVFVMEFIGYLQNDHHSHAIGYYFQRSFGEIFDFIQWTAIGTAAAVWAYFATKARNKNKKVLYYLMIAPLFAVILLELVSFSIGMYHYLVQEYNIAHGIMKPDDSFYACQIASFLTSLISLCMSVYCYFFRKRFANERSCKESGGANPDPDAEESR